MVVPGNRRQSHTAMMSSYSLPVRWMSVTPSPRWRFFKASPFPVSGCKVRVEEVLTEMEKAGRWWTMKSDRQKFRLPASAGEGVPERRCWKASSSACR